ncbi:YeiH family protein [Pseudoduganella sp. RAF53_2]|uniref:YeiH family protein n=1 Tax=unclassified Pseudoduganella TaxID=2637179 RepID=UPI003F9C6339
MKLLPGLIICGLVTGAAVLLEREGAALLGHAWLEPLVIAILLGSVVRTWLTSDKQWPTFDPGVQFSARFLLEVAVMLLGASVSARSLAERGPALLIGIAGVVAVAIAASYAIGRALRLPHKMAVLIACGNSICGNSAIAAVAPVIDADGRDVAGAIAFTAVLGVAVVQTLPLLDSVLGLSPMQYGVLAGLTVYAVPQVLAATAPVSMMSLHIGTLVKLVRVLMLGPVVLALPFLRRGRASTAGASRPAISHLLPWFILGFLSLMALRTFGVIPQGVLAASQAVSGALTTVSMAALGLGTDLRAVLRAGPRVSAAVVLSLLVLTVVSLALIKVLHIT